MSWLAFSVDGLVINDLCHRIISRGVTAKWFPNPQKQAEFTERLNNLESSAPSAHPEAAAISQELKEAFDDCLEQLSREKRLALDMYLLEQSAQEVAERIGDCSANNVYTLAHRAKTDLRKCLNAKGLLPEEKRGR